MKHNPTAVPANKRPACLIHISLLAVSLVFTRSSDAVAQAQPVIFQHGIASDASTWETTANGLAAIFNLTPYRFTTGAQREYEVQTAVYLNGAMGLPDTTIAVGHSNGGIISREANREGRALKGIVTVGTPHQGAGIAANVLNGEFNRYIGYLGGSVLLPFNTYAQYYDDNPVWNFASLASSWVYNFATFFQDLPTFLELTVQALLTEASPGSTYFAGLNSPANLAREAAAIPNRVAIVSTLSSYDGVIFRTLFGPSTTNDLIITRLAFEGAFLGAYYYYDSYDDYYDPYYYPKLDNAYMWYSAYQAQDDQDGDWCWIIGAADGYHGCLGNDAAIPSASQVYPNYTRLLAMSDVPHGAETSSSVTFSYLRDLFTLGPLRIAPAGATSSGLTASLLGPTMVTMNDPYSWSANASGGQAPYTYAWSVDGVELQRGPNASFAYTNQGNNFTIGLSVGDTSGQWVFSSLAVTVQACGTRIVC